MNTKILFPLIVSFYIGFAFLSMPPALHELMTLYGVSYTVVSFLLSAMLWSHAIMQIPAGLLTDRVGIRKALFIGLIFLGIGNLLGAIIPSYSLALAGRIITGFGTGIAFVTNMKLIAMYAPKNRIGSFQAFAAGTFSCGSILAFVIIPYFAGINWHWIYLIPASGCIPLLLFFRILDIPTSTGTVQAMPILGQIFRMPGAWTLGLIHALGWGIVITFGNWMPSMIAEVWGSSSTSNFAWIGALGMLISGFGRLSGGFILIKFSPVLVARGSVLTLTILFGILFLVSNPVITLCLTLLALWFGSINFGAVFHQASKSVPASSNATIFGFINFLGNIGGIFFILILGWIKDTTGSFELGFALLCACALITFLLSRIIKE